MITKEFADQEFDRFCQLMDLDVDAASMNEEDRIGFDKQRGIILRVLVSGELTIDDDGQPNYLPRLEDDPKPIVFREPTGATYMAMDRRKKQESIAKSNAMLAEMTGEPAHRFAKMKNRDYKVVMAILTLFLA